MATVRGVEGTMSKVFSFRLDEISLREAKALGVIHTQKKTVSKFDTSLLNLCYRLLR